MIRYGLLVASLLASTAIQAEKLEVDYASFYSHVKKINDEETNQLRFAFGFMHVIKKELCHIAQADVVTQKKTIPLTVENHTRFTVPVDKVLKMAKAKVAIELNDNANQCDMSVQLETQPQYLKSVYSFEELNGLLIQYQAFFSNMGSFLSFMMPSAEGLVLHFGSAHTLPSDVSGIPILNGKMTLNQDWFKKKQGLSLPVEPLRITALVVK